MASQVATATANAVPVAGSASGINLLSKLAASPLRHKPFDYVYMEGVFSPDFYRRLRAALPATDRYRELKHEHAMMADGHSTRRKFYLYPEHLWFLPAANRAVLREVARLMMAPETRAAFKQKFRAAIERRFGCSIDRLDFHPVPILVRDLGGYKIGIHADSPRKAIQVQFYLPRDDRQMHLGTVFHEGRSGEAAQRTVAMKFAPASAYSFPVVQQGSWHSVPQTSTADGERDSLMLTYYVQKNGLERLLNKLKRVAVFVGYYFRR